MLTQCDASDLRTTIWVGSQDTGIPNALFTTGCTMNDYVGLAALGAPTRGAYVNEVARLAALWVRLGFITDAQKDILVAAAARRR